MTIRQPQLQPTSDVGVIVPVFNRARTLVRTLPYVVAQTAPPNELVIVDDGSTDDSASAARHWLSQHGPAFQWQVIHAEHVGAAAARNVGLRALGNATYVAFLDSDDHWPVDFLQRTSQLLRDNSQAVAASVDRRYLTGDGSLFKEDDCSALAQDPIPWMFFNGGGIASCTLLRRDVVNRVGDWPDHLGIAEDLKLFCDIAQCGMWLHSPGLPTEFDLGAAAACGEAGNLSQRYERADWRWVFVYEQIYQELCERNFSVDRAKLQAAIAIVWNRAGKQLLMQGERGEAQQCFVKSIRWKPGQFRAWKRLVVNSILSASVRTVDRGPSKGSPLSAPSHTIPT